MDYKILKGKLDQLDNEMAEKMNEQANNRYIISDGVMKIEEYFSREVRLAWMLKEPYDRDNGEGGGWSYFAMFPEGYNLYLEQFNKGHKSTWHPMIYISYAIHNEFLEWKDMDWLRDNHSMCDIVRSVAFINSQKLPSKGVTLTDMRDLWKSIKVHGYLLKRQVELLDPNVLIFANTIKLYEDVLGFDLSKKINHGTCDYLVHNGKLLIDAYHPSQKKVTRDRYINDIVTIVKKWKNEWK